MLPHIPSCSVLICAAVYRADQACFDWAVFTFLRVDTCYGRGVDHFFSTNSTTPQSSSSVPSLAFLNPKLILSKLKMQPDMKPRYIKQAILQKQE